MTCGLGTSFLPDWPTVNNTFGMLGYMHTIISMNFVYRTARGMCIIKYCDKELKIVRVIVNSSCRASMCHTVLFEIFPSPILLWKLDVKESCEPYIFLQERNSIKNNNKRIIWDGANLYLAILLYMSSFCPSKYISLFDCWLRSRNHFPLVFKPLVFKLIWMWYEVVIAVWCLQSLRCPLPRIGQQD